MIRNKASMGSAWKHTAQEHGVAEDEVRWVFYTLGKRLELFMQITGKLLEDYTSE